MRAQKRWLLQRSLKGTTLQREWLDKPCWLTSEHGSFSRSFERKIGGRTGGRKLRTEERGVAGESRTQSWKERFPGMTICFFRYFPFFPDCPGLILSDFSFPLVGLFCFGGYWLNIGRVCCILCPILTSIFPS